jgi:hypothetical protein
MKIYRELFFFAVAMALISRLPAYAVPAMDFQPEDLMAQASDVKKSLSLNPNQQVLWQQIETKTKAILADRLRRREKLQFDLNKGLADSNTELRDLAKRMETEADLGYQESKQLRELWLTVNDALDDAQRKTIFLLLADLMQRIPDQGHECKASDQPHGRAKQRAGGMGGANSQ